MQLGKYTTFIDTSRGLYDRYGLGVMVRGGCLGGQVGRDDSRFFREIVVDCLFWRLSVKVCWWEMRMDDW